MANVRAHRRVKEVKPGDTIRIIKDLVDVTGLLQGHYLRRGQTLVVECVRVSGCPRCIGLDSYICLLPHEFEIIIYP